MNFLELLCQSEGLENPRFNLSFIPCETQRWKECRLRNIKLKLEIENKSDIETDVEETRWSDTLLKVPGILICDVSSTQGNKSTAITLSHLEYSVAQTRTFGVMLILVVGMIFIVFLIVTCVACSYKRSWKRKNLSNRANKDLKPEDIITKVHQFRREKVQLVEKLRQGEYGVYWKAIVTGVAGDPTMEMLVMAKEAAKQFNHQELLMELKTYVEVGHHINVLNLLGVVAENMTHGELFVITEYCRFGNLKDFMKRNRHSFHNDNDIEFPAQVIKIPSHPHQYSFNKLDLLYWSYQIACGLQYLASREFVYGNLSARHVLLGEGNIVKLSNFGSSRPMQNSPSKLTPKNILSLERMAPECLEKGSSLTSSSDVWSYGVLLWELFSLGCDPCWRITPNSKLDDSFECVNRLPIPKYADGQLFQMMQHCWKQDPLERPSFVELGNILNSMLPSHLLKDYEELRHLYSCVNAIPRAI